MRVGELPVSQFIGVVAKNNQAKPSIMRESNNGGSQ
jgi:hypothetical protein